MSCPWTACAKVIMYVLGLCPLSLGEHLDWILMQCYNFAIILGYTAYYVLFYLQYITLMDGQV